MPWEHKKSPVLRPGLLVSGLVALGFVFSVEHQSHHYLWGSTKAFIKDDLIPQLWPRAVVVMDNLKAHKVQGIQQMLKAVGAKIIYLPPYSPELNPIEHLWWELKAFVRRFRPKDQDSIHKLLEIGVLLNSSHTRKNYFTHCCYCAT